VKSRPAPQATSDRRKLERLKNDRQVKRWAQRIKGDPSARPHDLSEDQLRLIADELLKRRGVSVSSTHFERALEATRPILAVPDLTDPAEDLDLIFQLPELQDFWQSWQRPLHHQGSRGPSGSDEPVKALMALMAIPGMTTHAQTAHGLLTKVPAFQRVFERVGQAAAKRAGQSPPGSFEPLSYAGALKHRAQVAEGCSYLAQRTNFSLIRSLRDPLGGRVGQDFFWMAV
jgi:hypothetical protein